MALLDVLPRQRIHILAGVRDTGKTRFIIPAMLSAGVPWVYVAHDRSRLDAEDTIRDMGYQLSDIPLIPAYGREHKGWLAIVEAILRTTPLPEFAVIEAFQDLADSINRRAVVHEYMNRVDSYLQPSRELPAGLTIIGMTGSPKQSRHDRYPDPTQRIPGTAIWSERASTTLLIESAEANLELTTPNRIIWVCRKSGPRLKLSGVFTADNRLVFPAL